MTKLRLTVLLLAVLTTVNIKLINASNKTSHRSVTRSNGNPRFVIFNKGGQVRLVCGLLAPTFIPKYQNINVLTNWSVGFALPTLSSDLYSKLKGNINFQQVRANSMDVADDTRRRFYVFLEHQFDSWGRNGRACLLRTICEIAEAPIRHNGLIGELLHVVFTPSDGEDVNEEYKVARRAGALGADCQNLFDQCPFSHGILDKFSVLGLISEIKNVNWL